MSSRKIKPNLKKPNRKVCSVKNCNGTALSSDSDIHFHMLPKSTDGFIKRENYFGVHEKVSRLKAWQIALGIGNHYSTSFIVCSRHFKKDDYIISYAESNRKYLKKTAVPSLHLPSKKTTNSDRSKRLTKRKIITPKDVMSNKKFKIQASSNANECIAPNIVDGDDVARNFDVITESINSIDIVKSDGLPKCSDVPATREMGTQTEVIVKSDGLPKCSDVPATREMGTQTEVITQDVAIQVCKCTRDVSVQTDPINIMKFIKTDSELSTMTGLQSFNLLDTIREILGKCYGEKEFAKSVLGARGKLILTYTKLKQNMSYSGLAILFQISAKHCQRIFSKTINMLSKALRVFIDWPSRQTISRNLPLCFEGFEDVRVVLDCTEIHIQHTKCLDCQMSTFSQYKGGLTAKFMTGVSPSGSITFVSKMYGGKSSDTAIFNQSDLIKLLEHGDGVMVDKGFLIESTCEKNGWRLHRPSYLRGKQLSKDDTDQSCDVSRARVHIERSNQRLKCFQILSSSVPCEVHPLLEDIFMVICSTVNLSSPIIADSNFMKDDSHNLNQNNSG